MLSLKQPARAQPQQQQQQPQHLFNRDGTLQNPQVFLDSCLSSPAVMRQLPPALRDAVSSGDVDAVQAVFRQLHRDREQRQMEAQLIRPGEDPMDPEVQVCCMAQWVGALHCCMRSQLCAVLI